MYLAGLGPSTNQAYRPPVMRKRVEFRPQSRPSSCEAVRGSHSSSTTKWPFPPPTLSIFFYRISSSMIDDRTGNYPYSGSCLCSKHNA
jgi:hypothetical protein